MTLDLTFRKKYEDTIRELEHSIASYDEKYTRTGDLNFSLFRDHNIRQLQDLKEFILKREREIREESAQLEFDFQ